MSKNRIAAMVTAVTVAAALFVSVTPVPVGATAKTAPPYPITLVNGDFEGSSGLTPAYNNIIPQTQVPGWSTTEYDGGAHDIEIWGSGFIPGIPSPSITFRSAGVNNGSGGGTIGGGWFAEINANIADAAIYQDLATTPGALYQWSFLHRGRSGTDAAQMLLGDPANAYTSGIDVIGLLPQTYAQRPTASFDTFPGSALVYPATGPTAGYAGPQDGTYLTATNGTSGWVAGNWTEHLGYYNATSAITRYQLYAAYSSTGNRAMGNLIDNATWLPVAFPTAQEIPAGSNLPYDVTLTGQLPGSVTPTLSAPLSTGLPDASASLVPGLAAGYTATPVYPSGYSSVNPGATPITYTVPVTIKDASGSTVGQVVSYVTVDPAPAPATAQVTYESNYPGGGPASGVVGPDTVNIGDADIVSGDEFDAPVGYRFDKWNTASDGSGTDYYAGDATAPVTANGLTLYAQWARLYPNISVEKTADSMIYETGDTITYLITVRNSGDGPSGVVTVTDDVNQYSTATSLVAGSAGVSATTEPALAAGINSASPAGGSEVIWTIPALDPGQTAYLTLQAMADYAKTDATNAATAAWIDPATGAPSELGPSSSTVTVNIEPPEIDITKIVAEPADGKVENGGTVKYEITVINTSDILTEDNVQISDILTSGLTYSHSSPPASAALNPATNLTECVWNLGSLAPLESRTIELYVTVGANASGDLSNQALATWVDPQGARQGKASDPVIVSVVNYFTVAYFGNGNTSGTAPSDPNVYPAGSDVYVLSQGTLVKEGYTFAGWSRSANASVAAYPAGGVNIIQNIEANVTLYAVWTPDPQPIVYLPDYPAGAAGTSGAMAADTANTGSNYTLNANAFVCPGYTFAGWVDDQGNAYPAGGTITNVPVGGVTLHAQWTKNPPGMYTLTVKYVDSNGGTLYSTNTSLSAGSAYSAVPSIFTFNGQTYAYVGLGAGSNEASGTMNADNTVIFVMRPVTANQNPTSPGPSGGTAVEFGQVQPPSGGQPGGGDITQTPPVSGTPVPDTSNIPPKESVPSAVEQPQTVHYTDESGNVVAPPTSGTTKLRPGDTITLNGKTYTVDKVVRNDDWNVTLVLKDAGQLTATHRNPKTGDTAPFPPIALTAGALAALCLGAALFIRRRKIKQD